MARIRELIRIYGRAERPILILGERGTGKGLVARIIHSLRGGSEDGFLTLNCSAVPEALAESQLFGHRRGSFTGAVTDREGLLLAAFRAGGGLLLDDVAEFPPGIQPKLLHAVEDGSFYPVGSDSAVSIRNGNGHHFRIYATSQPDALAKLRPDLRDRLSACVLELPPLRDRAADIAPLAHHKLASLSQAAHGHKDLDGHGQAVLLRYRWPGNVRQLFNVLDRAFVLVGASDVVPASVLLACIDEERRLQRFSDSAPQSSAGTRLDEPTDRFLTLRELEVAHIRAALGATGGSVTDAAKLLGLRRTTLQSRLRALARGVGPQAPPWSAGVDGAAEGAAAIP